MKKLTFKQDKIFFTSDTHFYHHNIIKFEEGYHDFKSIRDHDEKIIENWNKKVPKDAIVFHLGDFALAGTSKICNTVDRLNGQIKLILGNHDEIKGLAKEKFFSIDKDLYIRVTDEDVQDGYQHIHLYHYPLISWPGVYHGAWCLHGHTHQTNYLHGKQLNVGVVNHNYEPLSYKDVKTIMNRLKKEPNPALVNY